VWLYYLESTLRWLFYVVNYIRVRTLLALSILQLWYVTNVCTSFQKNNPPPGEKLSFLIELIVFLHVWLTNNCWVTQNALGIEIIMRTTTEAASKKLRKINSPFPYNRLNKLCAWRHNMPPPPCKFTISSYLFARWRCCSGITISIFIRQVAPVPACWLFKTSATSWPFDLESGVRVTCNVGYLCANFSLPRPLFSS